MAGRARPTLRCLREDLGQAVPPADTPLDEVPHPLLAKASERFADDGTPPRAHRVRLCATVCSLLRESLLDGREHAAMLDGSALGIQVLADQGHLTYVAVRIIGSVPRRLVATILSLIPAASSTHGCPTTPCPNAPSHPKSRSGPLYLSPMTRSLAVPRPRRFRHSGLDLCASVVAPWLLGCPDTVRSTWACHRPRHRYFTVGRRVRRE